MAHAFSNVDRQPTPRNWVETLDRLAAHPFYVRYKRRLRERLEPQTDGCYLEVGIGTGADALAAERETGARFIGLDLSSTMVREARGRGLLSAVVADAAAVPFRAGLFDGYCSDRTFQHVADPAAALREAARVVRPGGRIVAADPDYSTQTLAFPDQLLACKVLAWRAKFAMSQGDLGHRMAALMITAGLETVTADELRLVIEDPTELDGCLGLRTWVEPALERGLVTEPEATRWSQLFEETLQRGQFRWSVSFFVTTGSVPAQR
jgi:SAM-dependent methyltransferase